MLLPGLFWLSNRRSADCRGRAQLASRVLFRRRRLVPLLLISVFQLVQLCSGDRVIDYDLFTWIKRDLLSHLLVFISTVVFRDDSCRHRS